MKFDYSTERWAFIGNIKQNYLSNIKGTQRLFRDYIGTGTRDCGTEHWNYNKIKLHDFLTLLTH